MITLEHIFALSVFALVTIITPGPNNLMLMASGINFGLRQTIPHWLGISVGFTVMLTLIGLGIGKVFELYPSGYTILKYVSAAYLLYLASKIASAQSAEDSNGKSSKPLTFLQAAIFQWVNPKAWTVCISAVSVFILPEAPELSLLVIVGTFALIGLPSTSCWAILGTQVKRFLDSPLRLRVFNWLCAILLVATLYPVFF